MQYKDPGKPDNDDIAGKTSILVTHPCFNKHDMKTLKKDLWDYICMSVYYHEQILYIEKNLPVGVYDAVRHYLNGWMQGSFPK